MHNFCKELKPHPKVNQSRTICQGRGKKVTASTKALLTSIIHPNPARSRKASHGKYDITSVHTQNQTCHSCPKDSHYTFLPKPFKPIHIKDKSSPPVGEVGVFVPCH